MFDFEEYLRFSKSVERDSSLLNKEVYRRIAVSRAYYSAYMIANKYVKERFGDLYNGTSGIGSHQQLWTFIRRLQKENGYKISEKASRILKLRHDADYNPNKLISKHDLMQANLEATDIIKQIKSLTN